ncbi:MAG: hypothetical protein AAGJ46_15155 [Planctomycetota bacterium]
MFRSALATIGVAALAFGAQSWLLGAMAQGNAQPAAEAEADQDATPSAKTGRAIRKSYLDRLIERAAEFGDSLPQLPPPVSPPVAPPIESPRQPDIAPELPPIPSPSDVGPTGEPIPEEAPSPEPAGPMFAPPALKAEVEPLPAPADEATPPAKAEPAQAADPVDEADGGELTLPPLPPPTPEPIAPPDYTRPGDEMASEEQSPSESVKAPPAIEPHDQPETPPRPQPPPPVDWEGKPVAFPPLPPDPYAEDGTKLPPLRDTLAHHGGAHLYTPEGDAFPPCGASLPPSEGGGRHPAKRLPEWFQPPQPCTRFAEYLGADPIKLSPKSWPGAGGYQWEPRFVAHGGYDAFGIAFREGDTGSDLVGHNLTLDFDLRLTGTERFHVQHRPIGEDGTGGSFYQFSDPDGYVDNSTAEPARVWFECELASVLSGWLTNPTVAYDLNLAVGKFLLQQHNTLLINDEVAGVILGQNNLLLPGASNLNARFYWLFDDINSLDGFGEGIGNDGLTSNVLGADAAIDFRHAFIELTYAFRDHSRSRSGDAHYLAASATQFFGPATLTGRVLAKVAGAADRDGQLYVLEWATHRALDRGLLPELGCHHCVFYATGFYATPGWDPIASANFSRLRASFELNPLVQVARGDRDETPGVALGVQLFGPGENSSLTPELAYESPDGVSIFGAGLRWQRRTSVQSFVELRGLVNYSDHSPFDRDGVFASHHWVF